MSNQTAPAYVVTITYDSAGRRRAERYPVPHWRLALALSAETSAERCQRLAARSPEISDRAINDALKDLRHELARRAGTLAELGQWDRESDRVRLPKYDRSEHAAA